FSRCGGPQKLQSFPTRRSSDLTSPTPNQIGVIPMGVDERGVVATCEFGNGVRLRPVATVATMDLFDTQTTQSRTRNEGVRAEEIDRKSTRLNSSHVAISYAVFC